MIEEIGRLFLEYIDLDATLESKGGRSTANDKEQEKIYTKLLGVENNILKLFGLPPLMKFRELLFEFIATDKSENEIQKTIAILSKTANKYLSSSPTSEIDILRAAKLKNLKTYEVLPEVGIDDSIYAMFLFEEVFKKNRCSEIQLISILKAVDEDKSKDLGHIHYNKFNRISDSKTDLLLNRINIKQVKYLQEFIEYAPTYPY